MYSFACKDMGIDCSFEVHGKSADLVKKWTMAHAKEDHQDILKGMSSAQLADMDKNVSKTIKKA